MLGRHPVDLGRQPLFSGEEGGKIIRCHRVEDDDALRRSVSMTMQSIVPLRLLAIPTLEAVSPRGCRPRQSEPVPSQRAAATAVMVEMHLILTVLAHSVMQMWSDARGLGRGPEIATSSAKSGSRLEPCLPRRHAHGMRSVHACIHRSARLTNATVDTKARAYRP